MAKTSFPTLGILGGGQLGKMMAAEAVRMGIHVRLLSPKDAGPMQFYADTHTGDWTDPEVLRAFAEGCTTVTVESEWAPAAELADAISGDTAIWPSPETLSLIKDKGVQKQALANAGVPVPPFACCGTLQDALDAADGFGYPVVLKQYRGSYDGYGNATVESASELRSSWPDLADDDGLLVEDFMPFERELAVQVARRPGGEQVAYEVAYTEQRDHRCHAVVVPADLGDERTARAKEIAGRAVDVVDGVGLIAVELFDMPNGEILVNELAPRPHNTGHYSIEGCHTSQFENHVRAVLDLPLGSPELRRPVAVMVNVLGQRDGAPARPDGLADALDVPGASVHVYGKPDVRSGRKMGHVTVIGDDRDDVRARAETAASALRL